MRWRDLLDQRDLHPNDKLGVAPRVALTWLIPPGRKRSKGNWALVGARGVFTFLDIKLSPECVVA